ncbi:hypothetical protein SEPCBS57363_006378 [Sporothrix epigloea]|uniref:Siderophore iron transporter n=1 Tax=Sporothrix epigloea TaxID=1892477 RepID=A0ABP0E5W6_9PEZI
MATKTTVIVADAAIAISDGRPELDIIEKNEKEIDEHPDTVTKDAQAGIRKAEAAALLWSKPVLYCIFAWIWLAFLVVYAMGSLDWQLEFYIYAEFSAAPQVTQANMIASIVGGVLSVPISKLLNTWGRAEAFTIFVALYTVGLAALAGCKGPSSFAAGYVLYNLGYGGIYFILNIFVADTSGLYNRAILIGITGLPTYLTSLAGPPIVQMFIDHGTWRWAYGSFAIIAPVVMLPLAFILKMYQKKAEKQGIYTPAPKIQRTLQQSISHYAVEFDFVGAFLMTASFLLMTLPFTLHSPPKSVAYNSATAIVCFVLGFLLFPVFVLWECYGLPKKTGKYYLHWQLLKNRTVIGACLLGGISWFNDFAWSSYFYYYIMVVYNYTATQTGYAMLANGFVATAIQIVLGFYIRRTKHFKNVSLFFGVPMSIIGAALLVRFRSAEYSIGLNILAQIFIGLGWGTLLLGYELAAYASSDRDGIPMVYALINLVSSLFSSVSRAVSTAIYTSVFSSTLLNNLPPDTVGDYLTIMSGGSWAQMMYPVGSATRDAINLAYGETQKILCIVAAAVMVLAFPAIYIWKDYRIDRKQVKGNVF